MAPLVNFPITLSAATFGGYTAATYKFMTRGYKPPTQPRDIDSDHVHNQNGIFDHVYDNGPGSRSWRPFTIVCDDRWTNVLGASATQQYANLLDLWNRIGTVRLSAPDGTFNVRWGNGALEPEFKKYPKAAGDKIEFNLTIQFEEA